MANCGPDDRTNLCPLIRPPRGRCHSVVTAQCSGVLSPTSQFSVVDAQGTLVNRAKGSYKGTGTEAVGIGAGEGEAMCTLPGVILILLPQHGKRRAVALDLDHLIGSYPQFQITIISL